MDEVHEQVLEMIATGELAPESRLLQSALAEELGVSRTPIREALLQLEREGLVYSVPGHGMFVKGATPTEVLEMYEVRMLLEPYAARLACQRATGEEIARIHETQRQLEGLRPDGDLGDALRINAQLHMQMVAPCGNQAIIRFLTSFWAQDQALRIYALQMARNEPAVARMEQDHQAMTTAFTTRDGELLERLLTEHIEGSIELVRRRQDAQAQAVQQEDGMRSQRAGAVTGAETRREGER